MSADRVHLARDDDMVDALGIVRALDDGDAEGIGMMLATLDHDQRGRTIARLAMLVRDAYHADPGEKDLPAWLNLTRVIFDGSLTRPRRAEGDGA